MTKQETIKILKDANLWRRGGEGESPNPKIYGQAIDNAILLLSEHPEEKVDEVEMKGIPEKIYLQLGEDIEGVENFKELEVSWCSDRINKTDIAYVRDKQSSPIEVVDIDKLKEDYYKQDNNRPFIFDWLKANGYTIIKTK